MTPDQRGTALFFAILDFAPAYGFDAVDPYLILAQSSLETGGFTSRRIVEDNNAFGMRDPEQRETRSLGPGPGGFATYATLEDSVQDYFMRQRYFNVLNTANAEAYVDSTMSEPYPYAEEGSGYIDAWLGLYADAADGGTEDYAWTVLLDPVDIYPEDRPSEASAGVLGALLLLLVLSMSTRS